MSCGATRTGTHSTSRPLHRYCMLRSRRGCLTVTTLGARCDDAAWGAGRWRKVAGSILDLPGEDRRDHAEAASTRFGGGGRDQRRACGVQRHTVGYAQAFAVTGDERFEIRHASVRQLLEKRAVLARRS